MRSITILVGVAGDDEARVDNYAEILEKLERDEEMDVLLAHVYSEDDLDRIQEMYDVDAREPHHLDTAAEHNTAVQELATLLDERDIDYEVRGEIGDPSDELVDLARDVDSDFVLIGGKKRSATGKALFGSTAQSILMSAPCAVIFSGPAAEW